MNSFPAEFPALMLEWYDKNRRRLPWREQPSPYRTWISEVMLQQTRVEAGIAYFLRFTEALPDVAALASVEEQVLLKLWEGLGYYSRAHNLKKAAQQVMEQYGGVLPADYDALCALPGLGEYSAGAIASIAFDVRVPAVDGNVLRVAARILQEKRNIEEPCVKRDLRKMVWESLPQQRVGDFNQSLMELGALICLPNGHPLCERCPAASLCESRRLGVQETLPVRSKKPARRTEEKTVLLLWQGDAVLLLQRPARGLLASMWEFPTLPGKHTAEDTAAKLGLMPEELCPLGEAEHIFTHIVWKMTGYEAVLAPDDPLPEGCRRIRPQEILGSYPVPSAYRAYLAHLFPKKENS